jgi:hypothetical protein
MKISYLIIIVIVVDGISEPCSFYYNDVEGCNGQQECVHMGNNNCQELATASCNSFSNNCESAPAILGCVFVNNQCKKSSEVTCSDLNNNPDLCGGVDYSGCVYIDGSCISSSSVSCNSFKNSNSCNNNELYDVNCIYVNGNCVNYEASRHTCSSGEMNLYYRDICLGTKMDCFFVFSFFF